MKYVNKQHCHLGLTLECVGVIELYIQENGMSMYVHHQFQGERAFPLVRLGRIWEILLVGHLIFIVTLLYYPLTSSSKEGSLLQTLNRKALHFI